MSKLPKVELIVGEATKIEPGDQLFVAVDPQWGDMCEDIYMGLEHKFGVKALVYPVPPDAIKFYAIAGNINIEMKMPVPNE